MKYFITKYALTNGITELDGANCVSGERVLEKYHSNSSYDMNYWKPHWHKTREEAVIRAEKMRVKRIESLKKQIAKLEKLRFE